jgi:hypothetical protein
MRAIHVLFYKPEPDDHWINHVVTAFSPPYSHCDLQFDDDMATSIYQNETVYWQKKNFSRNNYDRVSLTFNDAEYNKVREFCVNAHRAKVQFDILGMVCSSLPVGVRSPQDKTFCTRYIIEALQQSERQDLLDLNPLTTPPSTLCNSLKGLGKGFIHVPDVRMRRLQ